MSVWVYTRQYIDLSSAAILPGSIPAEPALGMHSPLDTGCIGAMFTKIIE